MYKIKASFAWLFTAIASSALLIVLLMHSPASAAGEFITTWQTDIDNPSEASLRIPTYSTATYDYSVDWGDGSVDTNISADATHTYSSPGTYTVSISGTFPRIYFNNYSDSNKILSIDAWGDIVWSSMTDAFQGAENLTITAADTPDLSQATSLSGMFSGATSLNENINNWNVSNINNFAYIFENAESFNQPLDNWDVSNAQTLLGFFLGAKSFNQDINNWNVTRSNSFNSMFQHATAFNQPLDNWNVSAATDTRFMFRGASSFNQDISGWRLPLVNSMIYMFNNASVFNQDLSQWNVSNLQRAEYMFTGSALSPDNYDALLAGWRDSAKTEVVFFGVGTSYCNGLNDHAYLVDTKQWHITQDSFDPSTCGPYDIVFEDQADPTVNEFEIGTVIGRFTSLDVEEGQTYTYGFACDTEFVDSTFFTIVDNELVSNTNFDYNNPQDENLDNIYDICIRSVSTDGHFVEKQFSIQINDVQQQATDDEVVVEAGNVLGASTDSDTETPAAANNNDDAGGGPSDQPQPQVLADTDTATLASTGLGLITNIIVGIVITVGAIYTVTILNTRETYKLRK